MEGFSFFLLRLLATLKMYIHPQYEFFFTYFTLMNYDIKHFFYFKYVKIKLKFAENNLIITTCNFYWQSSTLFIWKSNTTLGPVLDFLYSSFFFFIIIFKSVCNEKTREGLFFIWTSYAFYVTGRSKLQIVEISFKSRH